MSTCIYLSPSFGPLPLKLIVVVSFIRIRVSHCRQNLSQYGDKDYFPGACSKLLVIDGIFKGDLVPGF